MKRVTISLIAATAFAAGAPPASAQDGYVLPPPPPVEAYPEVQYAPPPAAMPVQTYPGAPLPGPAPQVQYQAPYPTGPMRQYGYATPQYAPPAAPQAEYPAVHGGLPPVPSVGYTRDEREAWLADCRQQYYGRNRKGGGLIGGLLGAIGGGIAGHELTDGSRTRRIGGTLIGVGVGGLVGAAIGSAIGAATDRRKLDECEIYLDRYTGGRGPGPGYGYGYGYNYGYGYPAYTVMMVPVQVPGAYVYTAPTRHETRYEVEEVVEERVVVPQTKYVRTAPATKYVKPAPATKYVKQ